jgi:xylitol oxidase
MLTHRHVETTGGGRAMAETNWAGNITYRATAIHEPETVDDLRRIVSGAGKIRALGSRHCFNDIADSDELVSLAKLDPGIEIDREAMTVTVGAGVTYGHLGLALEEAGFALHNMASLPHISVGGAVATGTHGSGDRSGNLATAVTALELVTSDGDIVRFARGDAGFPGAVVSLGALGVVTRLTLRIEPTYRVRQQVFEQLSWDVALTHFDEIMACDTSVSLFTDFGDTVNEVWRKHRVVDGEDATLPRDFMGARAAAQALHPVARLSAAACTDQLGEPGPWLYRLPHFRMDAVPASGDEIQAEFMVPRRNAVAALTALRGLGPDLQRAIWTSEVRSMAGDDLWLSMAYGRDSIGIHFSYYSDRDAVARMLPRVEAALAPFDPRPHWGKVFVATAAELASRYERMDDFRALAARLDPRGAFRNAYLDRHVFG